MQVVVTGCSGFIGSTLAEALLASGHRVVGVDSFSDYYDVALKRRNTSQLKRHANFSLIEHDLGASALEQDVLESTAVIFHLAGQPGVRRSWRDGFETYLSANVSATQRLLEAVHATRSHPKVVYASSSSVYGSDQIFPVSEAVVPRPISPYGVTKLAGEHLCGLYAKNFGIDSVSLRFFTVYGPRQRPDMAFQRIVDAAMTGVPFRIFGDGSQIRDFTYVDDIVAGLIAAGESATEPGLVVNLAGGSATALIDVIRAVEKETGREVNLDRRPKQPGDPIRTGGTVDLARDALGWEPTVDIATGLRRQIDWQMELAEELQHQAQAAAVGHQ